MKVKRIVHVRVNMFRQNTPRQITPTDIYLMNHHRRGMTNMSDRRCYMADVILVPARR